jgi:hypothetical protein
VVRLGAEAEAGHGVFGRRIHLISIQQKQQPVKSNPGERLGRTEMAAAASNASAVYLDGLIRVVVVGGGVEARHLVRRSQKFGRGTRSRGEEDRTGNSGFGGEGFEKGMAFA